MDQLESLDAWKVGRRLAVLAYRLTLDARLSKHFALIDQIRRAALSVPANIAEGYALGTGPQLVKYLRVALGSTAELHTHLVITKELELADTDDLTDVMECCRRQTRVLVGLLKKRGARPG